MTRPQLQPNLLFYAQTLFCAKHEDITPDISWHRWNLTCKGASGPVTYKIVCSSAKQHRRVENVSRAPFPFKLVSVSSREYMKTEVSADWFAYNSEHTKQYTETICLFHTWEHAWSRAAVTRDYRLWRFINSLPSLHRLQICQGQPGPRGFYSGVFSRAISTPK